MRQPIAAYFDHEEPRPNVAVGDDTRSCVQAGWSEDDGWVDLTDAERPIELKFTPTWFEVIAAPK